MEEKEKNQPVQFKAVVATEVIPEIESDPVLTVKRSQPEIPDSRTEKAAHQETAAAMPKNTTETRAEAKTAPSAPAEPEEDEADEEIIFAGGDDPILPAQEVQSAPVTAAETDSMDDDSETEIVFAETEKKVRKKSIPVHKEKKKFPTAAVVAAAVAVCIAGAGVVVALNIGKNNTNVVAEASSDTTKSPGDNASAQISTVSPAEKDKADASELSEEPIEVSGVDTTSIVFGKNVTVEGIDLTGLTLTQAYDAMQDKMLELYEDISITVVCDGKSMTLTQADFNFDSDLANVLVQAYHLSRGELDDTKLETETQNGVTDFKVHTEINADSVDKAIEKTAKNFDIQPVDAKVTKFDPTAKEKFTYADGSNGFLLDHDELESQIKGILAQDNKMGSFSINTVETPFKVTLAMVKANTKLIASHRTTAANSYNSNSNMKLAIRAANGSVVMPGECFSFNEMTGDTTNGNMHYYANGTEGSYVPSTAYSQGQVVQDYGGGICQASTTIYNCALKAGMEIKERYSHMYTVSYASYGLDATVDYGNLDMRFKNPYDYPVYIATYVYDYTGDGNEELMVEMYGPISKEYDEIVTVGWVNYAGSSSFSAMGAQVYFKNGGEVKRVFTPAGSYDYHFEGYYTVINYMPSDPNYGPSVSATNTTPTVYSPNGCGSSAPVTYGTAEQILNNAEKGITSEQQTSNPNVVVTTSGSDNKPSAEVITNNGSDGHEEEEGEAEEAAQAQASGSGSD